MDIDHGMVKLLLPADATVDQWGIQWTGAGRVKDGEGAGAAGGRRVRITGRVYGGEIRSTAAAWRCCPPCSPGHTSKTSSGPTATVAPDRG